MTKSEKPRRTRQGRGTASGHTPQSSPTSAKSRLQRAITVARYAIAASVTLAGLLCAVGVVQFALLRLAGGSYSTTASSALRAMSQAETAVTAVDLAFAIGLLILLAVANPLQGRVRAALMLPAYLGLSVFCLNATLWSSLTSRGHLAHWALASWVATSGLVAVELCLLVWSRHALRGPFGGATKEVSSTPENYQSTNAGGDS